MMSSSDRGPCEKCDGLVSSVNVRKVTVLMEASVNM